MRAASTKPGRGDRLAGRRRVAEAVAADRAGVLADVELLGSSSSSPLVARLELVLVLLVVLDRLGRVPVAVPVLGLARWFAAISSVSIPASASIWWRRSSVPDARRGGLSVRTRSSPSMSP